MFLTAYNLSHYLLSRGLVSPQSIVDGDFVVAEAGRRNRNFKVYRGKHPGLFVKQIKSTDPQAVSTVQREAALYRTIHADPKYAVLARMIPKFIDYEPRRHAVTLGLTENAESLAERFAREQVFPENMAQLLGASLGVVHSQGAMILADPAARSLFSYQAPWPLTIDQTGSNSFPGLGAAGNTLSSLMQQFPMLTPMLGSLRAYWQHDSLIHCDMKWDNCLVRISADGKDEITIVDWELADVGDGAWDVATIFKEYIVTTILNAHARQASAGQNVPAPKPQTIDQMQPSIRAFWQAYIAARHLNGAIASAYLDRAVRFTAARLVIAVLEYASAGPQTAALGQTMLQMSVNILQAPQVAAAQLIGAPLTTGVN